MEIWIILIGLFLLALVLLFNLLVSRRNGVGNAQASLGAMLQKRHDLIPNLVHTATHYLGHESRLLTDLTELRSQALKSTGFSETSGLEQRISELVSQVRVSLEAYPDLNSSENFLQLQRALNEAEEQIAAARRTCNAAVKTYRDALQMFPSNIVAALFGFREVDWFEQAPQANEPPNLKQLIERSDEGD